MSEAKPLVLVTGATGTQGGATTEHLLKGGQVRLRALTRNPDGAKAQALAQRGVEVVKGDLGDKSSIERALAGVERVFSVQQFMEEGVEGEVKQGVALAEAAKAAGVQHFVYSSVEGAERQSGVPHFDSKWKIEQRIGELGLSATILRPVAFMDLLGGGGLGVSAFLGLLRAALGRDKTLQLIASTDIGWFAARALSDPAVFVGRALPLAGDELTVDGIAGAFQKARGRRPFVVPVPRIALRLMPREMGTMLAWFGEHGYKADIAALRREHPELLTLEAFLKR